MSECKSVSIPIAEKGEPEKVNPKNAEPKFPYREAIGSLLYLTCKTRPDMTYAVNVESRSMENPTQRDVQNVNRTLRYLKGSQDSGICFSKDDEFLLKAYSDSDYAGDISDW